MKLAHPNSVLPALKKALLLDQQALIDFFGHLRNPKQNLILENFFTESNAAFQGVRNGIEQCVQFELAGQGQALQRDQPILSPNINRRYDWSHLDTLITLAWGNGLTPSNPSKSQHPTTS